MDRMAFDTWDTFFNILLLFFWFRLWSRDDRSLFFNPFLAGITRVTDSVFHFLRPAFLGLPARGVAVIAILLLLALRAFAAPRAPAGWLLRIGFELREPHTSQLISFLAFTLLSFAIFLFKLCGLSLLFLRPDSGTDGQRTTSAFHALTQPFTSIPFYLRPPALFVFGIAIGVAVNMAGQPANSPTDAALSAFGSLSPAGISPALIVRCAVSAVAGWVDVLALLVQLMIGLIIGSWVALFTGAPAVAGFCREWTDFLLGPMRRYPLQVGSLDLTPIIFIVLLNVLHNFANGFLFGCYQRLVIPA